MSSAQQSWLKGIVVKSLGSTDRAFEYMLAESPANKELLKSFFANDGVGSPAAIVFSTTQMETSFARLVHGGKLSGDGEEAPPEPEPEPEPPAAEPAAEGEAAPPAEGGEGGEAAPPAEGGEAAPPAEGGEAAPPAEGAPSEEAAPPAEEAAPPPPPPAKAKPRQDPAELLQIHMHIAHTHMPIAACVGRLVYFAVIAETPGPIADRAGNASGVAEEVAGKINYGVLAGGSMMQLEQLLHEVYLPLLSHNQQHMANTKDIEAHQDNVEFMANLQKFGSQVQHAIQQMTGDMRLTIPAITIDEDGIDAAAKDKGLVQQLEAALEDWTPNIAMAIETQMGKQPVGKGPLAEIDFWRARAAAISTLYEQLNRPNARRMVMVLERLGPDSASGSLLPGFNYQFSELEKRYVEAKDNVKFLTTLERHFKHIRDGALTQILDTLPSMMNALRMVWVISRHYKDDTRMEPLFGRIGWEIANRVSTMVNMRTIFRDSAEKSLRLIVDSQKVLAAWEQTYLDMRQKIEESGRDNRWEFDRNKLFARTRYMEKRCGDLKDVAEILADMRAMLGPELKAVTGDAKGIDEVMARVEALVVPLETAPFDLFDRRYQTSWEAAMGKFRENVAAINETLQKFMDDSFHKLRNAEGAFDLLQKFRSMPQSQEAQAKLIERKTADILAQYEAELDHVHGLFTDRQEDPPLSKNQPPLAGAINWSHSLFLRIRKTIAKFQSLDDEMFQSEQGKAIAQKFVRVSKAIRHYEKGKFDEWKETVNRRAMDCLKQNIFTTNAKGGIVVNFDEQLTVLIRESKYLDRMGFSVPETALNVTLQEDKYHSYVESLNAMLAAHQAVLDSLSAVETELLQEKIGALRRSLDKGFTLLNWNSLSIPEFTTSCNKEIAAFQTVAKQMHKNSANIKEIVDAIAKVQLIERPGHDAISIPELGELMDDFEKRRAEKIDKLKRQYTQIGPLLIKVEEMVANTNSGRSPAMASYYAYWERQLFAALTRMVLSALQVLLKLLTPKAPEPGATVLPVPLFHVTGQLSAPEVLVSPPLSEINKALGKLVKSLVDSARTFVRWLHGSCIETPPQNISDEEDPIIFSYYSDIIANNDVQNYVARVTREIEKTFGRVNKELDAYRKYDQLWKTDKVQHLAKFEQKQPTCVMFDSRLQSYSQVVATAHEMEPEVTVDFIKIGVSTLLLDIQEHAKAWIQAIGALMHKMGAGGLKELHESMASESLELDKDPDTLDDLKHVLGLIADINRRSMLTKLQYEGLEEWYRTLAVYGYVVPEEETAMVPLLRTNWAALCAKAKQTDRSLGRVKKQFTIVTQGEVAEFVEQVKAMYDEFIKRGPGTPAPDLDQGIELMAQYTKTLAEMSARRVFLSEALSLFGLPFQAYPELANVESDLKQLSVVYDIYAEQKEQRENWALTLWSELDMTVIEKGMEVFDARLKKLAKEYKALKPFKKVEEAIVGFVASLPLIQTLKNDALRERHWKKIMEVTEITFDMNPKTFTLGALFDMQLDRFEEQVIEITGGATKELTIESGINQIRDTWRVQKFEVLKYFKGTQERGLVLKATDEIQQTLEDQMMNLSSMMSSRFVAPFLDLTQKWEKLMSLISEVIDVWMKVQAKWMYLEAIFVGSEDIRLQLPEEAKKFDRIHTAFKKIMTETQKNPNVLEACSAEGRFTTLAGLFGDLESCQKSLSDYLETKRTSFPRFYFLSDDELLQILGTSDPTAVQEHMLKLFDNTAALTFGSGGAKVLGMVSPEKEKFAFETVRGTEGAVENWLLGCEQEMAATLLQIHKRAVFYYCKMDRIEWLKKEAGMVVNTGAQIWWTFEVMDVFNRVFKGEKTAMKSFAIKCSQVLLDLIVAVRDPKNSKQASKKINTLIIIDVHARDIIDKFVTDSVLDEREFAWESQLRFFWDHDRDNVIIRQCSGQFDYGYEYQGLNGRLVITPLTDRCYMTCTQSLHYRLGCAPSGPAGTGKTETVKDLSKAMSVQCKVFCCGEGLDYKAMGSIYSGLVQTGAWGCFDEFNRIPVEVLSVVSAQIKCIQAALTEGLKRFAFEGREIALVATVGIYITMNPGYAGRAELPDNLKALFRPVVMVTPNLAMICENMLMSEGFGKAKLLAQKMTVLYRLAEAQLSKQYHYDFKLRALKSVLVMAGGLKRGSPEFDESTILMRALRDMNMPKFIYADVPLFRGLIADLFPGLDCPRVRYPSFNDAVEQAMTEFGMKLLDIQLDKVIQLYETLFTRHTTMIVGPTGGGKTACLASLLRAQIITGMPSKQFVINPKAQPISELYGNLDPATRDWTDGLLSNIFRDMNKPVPEDKPERRYIVYDGDVDAVWVENMNSVMDDNKLLTLPNGERIRLNFPTSTMLFEVFDLQYASPATISRCGMVYVDPKDIGSAPYLWRWLNGRPEAEQAVLRPLCEKYFEGNSNILDFVIEGIEDRSLMKMVDPPKFVTPMTDLGVVQQFTTMVASMLTEERNITDPQIVEAAVLLAITWSMGGAVVGSARKMFDAFLKKISGLTVGNSNEAAVGSLPGALPTLHDYTFDFEQKRWKPWTDLVPTYDPPPDGKFSSIMVPTLDTVRSTWLLDSVVSVRGACLFVGESGTAKTTVISKYLGSRNPDKFTTLGINFSSRTSSLDVQTAIEASIEKRTKDTFGPPAGKKLVVFVDDLNMPKVDTYGTQQPNALLKMLIDKGFIYDRGKELTIKYIKDMLYVAAMVPGRNDVDPRFIRLYNTFCITFPPEESIKRIYSTILERFFDSGAFHSSLKGGFSSQVSSTTMEIFNAIVEKLPPTPAKFHYIFNLRDLSRITEGVMMATPDKFPESKCVVRLLRNEILRVIFDRLVGSADKEFVTAKIEESFRKNFSADADYAMVNPVLFGDFMLYNEIEEQKNAGGTELVRLYEDMTDYNKIKPVLNEVLEKYNMTNKAMNLVLFEDCLSHLVSLHRLMRMPRGNALLVGVGGSGKQSITRLAAFTAEASVFTITLTRGYNEILFREDLKILYGMLATQSVAFFFSDAHVAEEGFLELVNNMLTAGMVPALYEESEKDGLISGVRDQAVKKGCIDSKDALWQYFVNKCRDALHVVLAMSPVGETLRVRCRSFPGMVNNTVIDWFVPWPEQALLSVAGVFLAEEDLPQQMRNGIVSHMVMVHSDSMERSAAFLTQLKRYNYVTPKNYLDFISNYRSVLKEERRKVDSLIVRLDGGLSKLVQAAVEVDAMQEKLKVAQVEVAKKSGEVKEMLVGITASSKEAEEKQIVAADKEKQIAIDSVEIAATKAEAEAALEEALPALAEAAEALNDLKKEDITELKGFNNPNILVKNACLCVVIMKGIKEVDWMGAKKMMNDMQFLASLLTFDKDGLTDKQVKDVRKFFADPAFTTESVATVSKAAGGLLKWVAAILNYNTVAKTVNPKREAVAKGEKMLRAAGKELTAVQAQVKELSEMLAELKVKFEAGSAEEKDLSDKAELMSKRLEAATKLIAGLGSERTRWTSDMEQLHKTRDLLVGDCLTSAAFLSYSGAFNAEFRRAMMIDCWEVDIREKKIALSEPFAVTKLLTSEVETSKWASEGLPSDDLSIQNGILTTRSSRYPLCIDPQQQAVLWIKKKEARSNLKVCTFNDSDFLKHLEIAVNLGFAFLFEGIDEYLDPIVDPVLEKNLVKKGNARTVKIGDKDVEWDDSFRMYLTSKIANPHYGPEIFGKVMIINYSVTVKGLEDQLLNSVVFVERNDLAQQAAQLVEECAELATMLKELEDTLLFELANSTGNILDNTDLISTLEQTKTKATEISAKLAEAKVTSQEIAITCAAYRPVAKRGSILFFVMSSLSTLNNMYELSLALYMVVFLQSLERAEKDSMLENRLENIILTLTQMCYNYSCRSIFEIHKLMFSLQMTLRIMAGDGTLDTAELDFFLKGNLSLEKCKDPPPGDFISDSGWHDMQRLIKMGDHFKDLTNDVKANIAEWRAWYDLDAPEAVKYPCGYDQKLNLMQKMMLLRCFRVDRVFIAITKFVIGQMSEYFVTPPVLDFDIIFKDSTPMVPVIFVLSPGADPATDLFKLSVKCGMSGPKMKYMALGQGQGPVAQAMLEGGSQKGHWVLLQNCHLLPSWLKTLEKILEKITNPHDDFRLWCTTAPTEAMPIGVLQRSIKAVTEPPNGLKLNMLASYSKVPEDLLEGCPHEAFRPCVFVLAFFHAVVQERRKYGKVGWNVKYDYNDSDFSVSIKLLENYLAKAHSNGDTQIPWDTLRYLVGEVMYGGRVTDDCDRRIVETYMQEYLGDFLFDTFQPFHFYEDEEHRTKGGSHGCDYKIPPLGNKDRYLTAIENFPGIEAQTPEVFGMHPNAEIDYLTSATKSLMADLIELQPREAGGGGGISRDDYISSIASDVESKLPSLFDLNKLRKDLEADGFSPVFVVLVQELERWDKLNIKMSKSLSQLKKAIKGEIAMSAELDGLGTNLFNGQLPMMWRKLTPQTDKMLGSWVTYHLNRDAQYKAWVAEGEPKVMWLSGLSIPETYTAALVQTTCRRYGWPLDKTTLFTKVTKFTQSKDVGERLKDGCYVIGLSIEGAAWDVENQLLIRQPPKVLVQDLPIMQIIPVEANKLKLHGTIRVPLYITQQRRNAMGVGMMMEADLDTREHKSHWILQGVALVLNTDA